MDKNNNTIDTLSTGGCVFGVQTLLQFFQTFNENIQGAKNASDIEYVHKTRVTSRRIRVALAVFMNCFPRQDVKRWREEIKKVTQALGKTRDSDVQICFLEQYLHECSDKQQRPGIEYLLTSKKEQRADMQSDVIAILEAFQASPILSEIKDACMKFKNTSSSPERISLDTYRNAQEHIVSCFTIFFSLEKYVHNSEAIRKHHQLRIAAKHLRYTMELFQSLYPNNLKEEIEVIKHLQDILGEVHDYDVWIEYIPQFLNEQKQRFSGIDNESEKISAIEQGLLLFLFHMREQRQTRYQEFVNYWEENKENGMFHHLEDMMEFSLILPSSYHTKIALLGDIHGNFHALQAVIQDARLHGAELFLNTGDFIGYGAFPQEVVDQVSSHDDMMSVIGNYDMKAVKKKPGKISEMPGDVKQISVMYAQSHLSKSSEKYLKSLPKELWMKIGEKTMLVVHGSPESLEEHIRPETSNERLRELAQTSHADMIVVGHSHLQFTRKVDHTIFINPGSVGRPGNRDYRAMYGLLTTSPFSIDLLHVDYDVTAAVEAIRKQGLSEHFAQMLLRGVSLDEVLEEELMRSSEQTSLGFFSTINQMIKQTSKKRAVKNFSVNSDPDPSHSRRVMRYALWLFDRLKKIHPLGLEERYWLEYAALLHDTGWSVGYQKHHKSSLKLILNDQMMPLTVRERYIIGCIARYHRKALPRENHHPYIEVSLEDRKRIDFLAGLLRIADALDASHDGIVKKIEVNIDKKKVMLQCYVWGDSKSEEQQVNKKKDLFEKTFNKELQIKMVQAPIFLQRRLSRS